MTTNPSTADTGSPPGERGAAGEGEGGAGITLAQALSILRAYWKPGLAVAVAVVFLAAAVTKFLPKTYTSVATLMVRSDSTDPLAEKEYAVNSLGNYVATQVELMQGPDVLDEVIARLDLTKNPHFAAGNRGGDATLRDWVEGNLRKHIEIDQGRGGSQLIYVSAWAPSAQLATDIANTVADVYLDQERSRTYGPASERERRYAEELADLKAKVEAAQVALTQFRGQTGGVDIGAKADVDMELLSSLEQKLLEARNALRSNQARASGQQDVSATVLSSNSVGSLRAEEAKLKSQMAELRSSLGPRHPRIIELQSQIDANQASLAAALSSYSNAATSDVSMSHNEVAALEKAVEVQRQKVLQNRGFRDRAAKYELELESAQNVYKRALDGYDQAKFASTGKSSTITLAARARLPVKADKPNAVKNMLAGTGLAIVLGLAVPFLLELPRRRIRCRDDLERNLGIPVLVEFPDFTQEGAPPPAPARS